MTAPATDEQLGRTAIVALAALSLGIFTVANDFTALSVAIPPIEQDLETTLNRTQWVINGYTVVFGVLIVTCGRLADLFGRRRVFLVGATLFGVFSLLGGLAPNIGVLIACRAVMGVGGAMMWPSVLGMVYGIVPAARSGLAGGLVLGVGGLGNAVGPLIGGFLTEVASWRWIFFVNLPVALLAAVVVRRLVSETKVEGEARVDYRGVATLSAGVILILVALDLGSARTFDSVAVIAMIGVGLLLLPVFVAVQRRQGDDALIPMRVWSSRVFSASLAATVCIGSTFFGVLLYIPQYVEKELGWGAFAAGGAIAPLMVVFALVSFAAGPLYHRIGGRLVVLGGTACIALGVFLLALLIGHGYPPLVPGLVVLGVGIGLFFSAVTTAAITSVGPEDSSVAGGAIYMANVAGGSVGLGVNTVLVLAAGSLAAGIRTAFLFDTALAVVGVVLVVMFVHGERSAHEQH